MPVVDVGGIRPLLHNPPWVSLAPLGHLLVCLEQQLQEQQAANLESGRPKMSVCRRKGQIEENSGTIVVSGRNSVEARPPGRQVSKVQLRRSQAPTTPSEYGFDHLCTCFFSRFFLSFWSGWWACHESLIYVVNTQLVSITKPYLILSNFFFGGNDTTQLEKDAQNVWPSNLVWFGCKFCSTQLYLQIVIPGHFFAYRRYREHFCK